MSKNIVIRIKKAGDNLGEFSISDNYGNILFTEVTKKQLIQGISATIDDNVTVIVLTSTGKNCCSKTWNIPITTITKVELAAIRDTTKNTASLWRHLTDTTKYNEYYGCVHPYIIEYPFSYTFQDEIVQNVKDYSKVYTYLPSINGVFDNSRKVQTDRDYFNKAILYNDQQSSGVLNLVAKPLNNLKEYMSYPKLNTDSKSILFTKSDNFYQYNTFWSLVKDKTVPLFISSCDSLSIDKEVNQDNMDYGSRSFKKETIRSKDLKVRHILDDRSDIHIVTQFIITPSQISYK